MNRRARKRIARIQEMLEVARNIVAQHGLEALTIAKLAKELDAAVGALYRYFPSKDALLLSLQLHALEEFAETLESRVKSFQETLAQQGQNISQSPANALAQILLVMHFYLDDAKRAPSRSRLIHAFMSTYDPMLTEEGARQGGTLIQRILSHAGEGLRAMELPGKTKEELEQFTHTLWALTHSFTLFRKRDRVQPEHLQTEVLILSSKKWLFTGWGLSQETIEQAEQIFSDFQEQEDD